jgi:hypothetical protein
MLMTFAFVAFIFPNYVSADILDAKVFTVDSKPYGIHYQEWVAKWWRWHMSIRADIHPREHYTPERCSLNQNGPVWFLADNSVPPDTEKPEERNCTIASGKAILVQIQGGECDYSEKKNDHDVETCVDNGLNGAVVAASVDGVEVKNLNEYRIGHYWFNITIPQDNLYNEAPGTFRALVDGWFLFLEPLPAGKHDVFIKADVNRVDPLTLQRTDEDHHVDLLYHLTVVK